MAPPKHPEELVALGLQIEKPHHAWLKAEVARRRLKSMSELLRRMIEEKMNQQEDTE